MFNILFKFLVRYILYQQLIQSYNKLFIKFQFVKTSYVFCNFDKLIYFYLMNMTCYIKFIHLYHIILLLHNISVIHGLFKDNIPNRSKLIIQHIYIPCQELLQTDGVMMAAWPWNCPQWDAIGNTQRLSAFCPTQSLKLRWLSRKNSCLNETYFLN